MLTKTKSLSIAALGTVQSAGTGCLPSSSCFSFLSGGPSTPASRKKTKRSDELAN